MSTALLKVDAVSRHFDLRKGLEILYRPRDAALVRAVDAVSFTVERGETFGIIGESGCGKSTLGRVLLRLQDPVSGAVVFDGTDITHLKRKALAPLRQRMQLVFQDPYASLNPRRTVGQIVGQPLEVHQRMGRAARREKVIEMLGKVGLPAESIDRYPHQFSGGQRQRIAIARALILRPELVVCDEAISALDVSVQAQVLKLLRDLQAEFGLTYVFISHNLAAVGYLCDRVAVMYLGRIVESGPAAEILKAPAHPYTEALLAAVPQMRKADRRPRVLLTGDLPSPTKPPPGCHFHTRCPKAMAICKTARPETTQLPDGRLVACHLHTKAEAL
ncbi:MAG TPA: dipeptide ABC transporter ATP-binding protein [Devosia sp.]|nr:dipeptide ABC transporter ATP-binding protein [Devosia sp.]